MAKPSKGTSKDRRLKTNKSSKRKRRKSGSKKLNPKKSAAYNKILVY